jgi:Inner membrane protein YgaP-like, transmembrane domain
MDSNFRMAQQQFCALDHRAGEPRYVGQKINKRASRARRDYRNINRRYDMKRNVGPREQLFRIAVGSAAVLGAALIQKLRGWRWLLGAWGVANITTGLTRYCPSNQLTGIDNTEGNEFVHFDESVGGLRGRMGQRLNELQHRVGATL